MSRSPEIAPTRGARVKRTFASSACATFFLASMMGCWLLTDVDDYKIEQLGSGTDPDSDIVDPPGPEDSGRRDARDANDAEDGSSDAANDAADTGPPPVTAGKKVFVTSTASAGDFGGLAKADARCKALADAAGYSDKQWVAWLSSSGSSAVVRLNAVGPWFLMNGTKVADTPAELSGGKIEHPIDITELNLPFEGDSAVWTGTAANGTSSGTPCQNWTFTFLQSGLAGTAANSDSKWTSNGGRGCGSPARFYCFEQ